jgi:hypothetical protein
MIITVPVLCSRRFPTGSRVSIQAPPITETSASAIKRVPTNGELSSVLVNEVLASCLLNVIFCYRACFGGSDEPVPNATFLSARGDSYVVSHTHAALGSRARKAFSSRPLLHAVSLALFISDPLAQQQKSQQVMKTESHRSVRPPGNYICRVSRSCDRCPGVVTNQEKSRPRMRCSRLPAENVVMFCGQVASRRGCKIFPQQ